MTTITNFELKEEQIKRIRIHKEQQQKKEEKINNDTKEESPAVFYT